MPLQDLTPELRTRLSRVERTVGWFVILAAVLLLAGFAFYLRATAKKRGWFVTKINYATALNDATGLKEGNPVKLMGFDVGEITLVNLNSPDKRHGVVIFFFIREPYYGYIWYDSRVRVMSDLLGNRYLEITKGEYGAPTAFTNRADNKLVILNRFRTQKEYVSITNDLFKNAGNANQPKTDLLVEATNQLMETITNNIDAYYTNASEAKYDRPPIPKGFADDINYCFIPALDTPDLQDRLNAVAAEIEEALPHFLSLTNQITAVLSNANRATIRLNDAIAKADPILTNLTVITGNLRDPNGSLGNWLVPTNLSVALHQTLNSATQALNSAHTTLDDADTNITMLALDLDKTLEHLADLTSNLNAQVQVNPNLITEISTTIQHTDSFIQGLKRHWLLRSAFKTKKPKDSPPPAPIAPRQKE